MTAVYDAELARVCDQAAVLARRRRPDQALRAWVGAYADFVATKRGMAEAVREVVAAGAVTSSGTRARLADAVTTILDAGGDAFRPGVRAEDVVAAMAGVVLTGGDRAQVDRVLDLVVAGVVANDDGARRGRVRW